LYHVNTPGSTVTKCAMAERSRNTAMAGPSLKVPSVSSVGTGGPPGEARRNSVVMGTVSPFPHPSSTMAMAWARCRTPMARL
jgi:hypothetical protein